MIDRIDRDALVKSVGYSLIVIPLTFLAQFISSHVTELTYVPHFEMLPVMIPSLAFVLYMVETRQ